MIELETERLRLRGWVDADHTPFAALNADPEVMAHFPAPLSRAESDALIARQHERWA
ncbi:MAG: GNAT family N-acetyltransferase, partial [Pseudomonadota bacterium]